MCDLCGAGIGRDDTVEARGEQRRQLPGAAARVPGEVSMCGLVGEIVDHGGGIRRPMGGVSGCDAGKVILEVGRSHPWA